MNNSRLTLSPMLAVVAVMLTCVGAGRKVSSQGSNPSPFSRGHLIAGISNGRLQHYNASGVLLETILTGDGVGANTTGCAFDSAGSLYVTTFASGSVYKIKGPGLPHANLGVFGSGYNGSPESIVFAANGQVYVGAVNGDGDIRKFEANGVPVKAFDVAIEDRGSDWIDLAKDQNTMFYTSEGKRILRFDLAGGVQMTDFAQALPGRAAYALRLLPNGEVLVADSEFVIRLDTNGQEVMRYDVAGQDSWFSLNLDPDGSSFWAGDFTTGKIFKFNISQGGVPLLTIDTGVGAGRLYGICLSEEITSGQQDRDGDAIPDNIEVNGYDYNGDGTIDLNLAALGAKPDHKDIFVQIDWLETTGFFKHSHKPGDDEAGNDSMGIVKKAFADAPVSNPDNVPGIKLHVIFGHPIIETDANQTLGTANGCNYSWSAFQQIKATNVPPERLPIFHYVIFGHHMPAFDCGNFKGRPSGISRHNGERLSDGGSDFLVTLGGYWEELQTAGGIRDARAGTFMHELGHNLGLGHGGVVLDGNGRVINSEDTRYKPNHLSVMNYSFQTMGLRKKVLLGIFRDGYFDYSRFGPSDLPDLDENNLDESKGLQGSDAVKDFGTIRYCLGKTVGQEVNNLKGAVDWNCNGSNNETNVAVNINVDEPTTVLSTTNEWAHLRFKGGAVGTFGVAAELPQETSLATSPELTFDEDILIRPRTLRGRIQYLPLIRR